MLIRIGTLLGSSALTGEGASVTPSAPAIALESSGVLLLESGNKLLLE